MEVNINVKTIQFNEIGEKNIIKLNTIGNLYQKRDHKYVLYKEIENNEETTTSLKIEKDKVTIKRFGALNSTLVFKIGYKDISRYMTPQGEFIIENLTKNLVISEGKNIKIDIDYDIKIMNMFTGRNVIYIKIDEIKK